MNAEKFLFPQVMDLIHPEQFRRCVQCYRGEYKVKSFSCWDQFLCMAFGQLTYRQSLDDIEICLRSRQTQLYHLGFHGTVSHSTLADANHNRDWRIYADWAQLLTKRARWLYQNEPLAIDRDETVYALDSTTLDLCLNLFPWARFRRTKAAIKLHTLLDLRGSIPSFLSISEGKKADVRMLDERGMEPGSFYVMDRGHVDFQRLYRFVLALAFFVTRTKSRIQFNRLESRPVEAGTGVRSDQVVWLRHPASIRRYPDKLRRVHYVDPDTRKSLTFLPNHFELPALVIALLEGVTKVESSKPGFIGLFRDFGICE
jgi:Domain of unknown function (DUF4372)/Transposase DDE domain